MEPFSSVTLVHLNKKYERLQLIKEAAGHIKEEAKKAY